MLVEQMNRCLLRGHEAEQFQIGQIRKTEFRRKMKIFAMKGQPKGTKTSMKVRWSPFFVFFRNIQTSGMRSCHTPRRQLDCQSGFGFFHFGNIGQIPAIFILIHAIADQAGFGNIEAAVGDWNINQLLVRIDQQ